MAKTNFYLKNPSAKEETLIYLFFHYDGKRLKYSTGETINPKYWNEENQRVSKSLSGSLEVNNNLDLADSTVKRFHREALTNGITATNEYLKEKLDAILRPGKSNSGNQFFDYLKDFIEVQKSFKTHRTIQKYNTLLSHLTDFQHKKHYTLTFEKIDSRFYELFTAFCMNELNLLNNSTAKYIKTLKTFLHWATERGFNKNLSFIKFKAKERDADIIYLTEKELYTLYNYDLSSKPVLDKVRDAFCFCCNTGLRYSDFSRLTKDNVKGDEINLVSEKTTDNLSIPLNNMALSILKKHNYSIPVISNQKTNEHLKELGKLVGIKETVTLTQFKGVEEIQTKKPKYNFIGTHTARRTFVTLSLEKGMRPETVMSITGHKEYNTFKKYIKITSKVKHTEMKKIWDNENPILAVV